MRWVAVLALVLSVGCGGRSTHLPSDAAGGAGLPGAGAAGGVLSTGAAGASSSTGAAGGALSAGPSGSGLSAAAGQGDAGGMPSTGGTGASHAGVGAPSGGGVPGTGGGAQAGAGGVDGDAGAGGEPSRTLVSLGLSPELLELLVGMQVPVQVLGNYADQQQLDVTPQAVLSTTNPGVARVQGNTIMAVAAGSATVAVTVEGVTAAINVGVDARTAVALRIEGVPDELSTSRQYLPRAFATLSDGTTRSVGDLATWSSSDARVALIASEGPARRVEPIAPGVAVIGASIGELRTEVPVVVTGAALSSFWISGVPAVVHLGDTFTAVVYATAERGQTRRVAAALSGSGLVQVTRRPSVTYFTASALGVGFLSASLGGPEVARVPITVLDPSVQLVALDVAVSKASFAFYETPAITAIGTYADGSRIDITRDVEWLPRADEGAHVEVTTTSVSLLRALRLGATTISAGLDGVKSSAPLEVLLGAPDAVLIEGSEFPLPLPIKGELWATASHGSSYIDVTGYGVWSLTDPSVATLTPGEGGRLTVTGLDAGSTDARISLPGLDVPPFPISFNDATLTAIEVNPADWTCRAQESTPLWAYRIFSDGSRHDLTPDCTWRSGSPDIVAVDDWVVSTATCLAPGTTAVTATCGTVSGSSRVSVAP